MEKSTHSIRFDKTLVAYKRKEASNPSFNEKDDFAILPVYDPFSRMNNPNQT